MNDAKNKMRDFSLKFPGQGLDLELSCKYMSKEHKYCKYSRKGSILRDRVYHHFPSEKIEHPGSLYGTLRPTEKWNGEKWVKIPRGEQVPVARSFCQWWGTADESENAIRCRFISCVSCKACSKLDFLNCEREDIVGPWYRCPFVLRKQKKST